MKLLTQLMFLAILMTSCRAEVLWRGGGGGGRLTLASDKSPVGGWAKPKGDELSFRVSQVQNRDIIHAGGAGSVGATTGFIQTGSRYARAKTRLTFADALLISGKMAELHSLSFLRRWNTAFY